MGQKKIVSEPESPLKLFIVKIFIPKIGKNGIKIRTFVILAFYWSGLSNKFKGFLSSLQLPATQQLTYHLDILFEKWAKREMFSYIWFLQTDLQSTLQFMLFRLIFQCSCNYCWFFFFFKYWNDLCYLVTIQTSSFSPFFIVVGRRDHYFTYSKLKNHQIDWKLLCFTIFKIQFWSKDSF